MTQLKSACTTKISLIAQLIVSLYLKHYKTLSSSHAPKKEHYYFLLCHKCYFHNLNQFIFRIFKLIPTAMILCI